MRINLSFDFLKTVKINLRKYFVLLSDRLKLFLFQDNNNDHI